jgi:hypothetical protein
MDYLIDQISYIPDSWKPGLKAQSMRLLRWSDWFCGLRDPYSILEENPSFLAAEIVSLVCGFLVFVHALRHGSRYWYLWVAILFHGINTECISYFMPDFESFWHAQSMVMLAGRRLPLHIVVTYGIFIYTASIAAKRLRLPWWAEGCAAGLGVVLIDLPYDIIGVKMLWWSWHDTDPNVADRMYHVPWTSYYFHAAFCCSFTWLLNGSRKLLLTPEYDWRSIGRELGCCLIAGLGTFWLGALQFIPMYHLFHDYFKIHTEVPTLIFLGFYGVVAWIGDRHAASTSRLPFSSQQPPSKSGGGKRQQHASKSGATAANGDNAATSSGGGGLLNWFDELFCMLLIWYVFLGLTAWGALPAAYRSTGLHEPIGACGTRRPVQTVSGMVLEKRAYLCTIDFHEPYYDFHCLKSLPKFKEGSGPLEWYTICGTSHNNWVEFVLVILWSCFAGLIIFYQLMSSGPIPKIPVLKRSKRKAD